jgi:hypothetical protein
MRDVGVDTLLREANDAREVDVDEIVGSTYVDEHVVSDAKDGASLAHGVLATYG